MGNLPEESVRYHLRDCNSQFCWCVFADKIHEETEGIPPPPTFKTIPRRGQYLIYQTASNISHQEVGLNRPLQPVPTLETKGIYLFGSIYNHLVVGPTAEDQEHPTDEKPNNKTTKILRAHEKRILPNIEKNFVEIVQWVGIRPSSTQRDYQVNVSHDKCWVTVGGIRSTGLTSSLAMGRYICALMKSTFLPRTRRRKRPKPTPLPPLEIMIKIGGVVHIVTLLISTAICLKLRIPSHFWGGNI